MADEQVTQLNAKSDVPLNKANNARRAKKSKSKPKANSGRRRGRKPYPVIPFEQALRIGQGISDFGAGHPMKRDTLLEKLVLANNQTTRDLITASSKYGITSGSHDAPELKLTEEGAKLLRRQLRWNGIKPELTWPSAASIPSSNYMKNLLVGRCPLSRRCVIPSMTWTRATVHLVWIFLFRTPNSWGFSKLRRELNSSRASKTLLPRHRPQLRRPRS